MPVQPQEVLDNLTTATAEAKEVLREVHSATKELRSVIKDENKLLVGTIITEVVQAVEALKADTAEEMRAQMTSVIDSIAHDWRQKLGLE